MLREPLLHEFNQGLKQLNLYKVFTTKELIL